MTNIATVLKDEITRLAKRQLRSETEGFKKASARYRADIAAMKRRIEALEKLVAHLQKAALRSRPTVVAESTGEGVKHRFSPARLHARRVRLGLSAADMGRLIGVSPKSIYDWESGAKRPRDKQLALIAAVRNMGKREAQARLDEIRSGS